MQRWADEEEQERSRFPRRGNDNNPRHNGDRNNDRSQHNPNHKRKPDDTVRAVKRSPRGKKQGNQQDTFEKILRKRCPIHPNSNHSMFDCVTLRKSLNAPIPEDIKKGRDKKDDKEDNEGPQRFQQPANMVNVIFGGDSSFSKRAQYRGP